jgi:hypothetical protein
MLKEHSNPVQQSLAAFDCALLALSFLTAYVMVSALVPLQPMEYYWATFAGFTFFYLYFAWRNSLFSVLHFGWIEGLDRRALGARQGRKIRPKANKFANKCAPRLIFWSASRSRATPPGRW